LSPWYATWWAYSLYFGTGIFIFSLIFFLELNRSKASAEARKLEEVSNAKSLFINTVSHELRTPLTSIMGFSKIIKKRLEEKILPFLHADNEKTSKAASQVMENIDIVISESERLTSLINDVLDLAKIESGKVVWAEDPIHLNKIIQKAVNSTSNLFEEKGLELKIQSDSDLPGTIGDEDRILQVVINLLSNALKFTKTGQVVCRAFVYQGKFLKVEVEDTGIGIPLEKQAFIFEKFGQALSESLTDKPEGTGLGLSICKEIIEHFGGQITVVSEPGKGSIFAFTLPIR
jgi:signal transduction histidine kinase